ncbi:MAG: VWA domain-containing protein, partial [Vicinamibacteria bacterium]
MASCAGFASAQQLVIKPATAQVVAVDVVVTDRKGRAVTDLGQEDFELYEDNRPVQVSAFEPPSASRGAAATKGAPNVAMSAERDIPIAEVSTVVIYVDRWLLSPAGRKRAVDQAAELAVALLSQGAKVLVIADENGLRPLTKLTSDATEVRRALAQLQGWATQSFSVTDTRHVLEDIHTTIQGVAASGGCGATPACVCALPQITDIIRTYATSRLFEAQTAAGRLAFVANAAGSLPGRKVLIYVSEGLEQRPAIQLFDQVQTICPEALSRDASALFVPMLEFDTSQALREATARANAARVTLYPIDARGLTGFSSMDLSQADRRYIPSAGNDMVKEANLTAQYHLLAEETGGF